MVRIFWQFWKTITFVATLLGLLYLAADYNDMPEAFAEWLVILNIISIQTALTIFSALALAYIFWIDIRPHFIGWIRQRKPVFSLGTFTITGHENGGSAIDIDLDIRRSFPTAQILITYEAVGSNSKRTLAKYSSELSKTRSGEMVRVPLASITGQQANSAPTHKIYWGVSKSLKWTEGDRAARCSQGDIVKITIDVSAFKGVFRQTNTIYSHCDEQSKSSPSFIFWEVGEDTNVLISY